MVEHGYTSPRIDADRLLAICFLEIGRLAITAPFTGVYRKMEEHPWIPRPVRYIGSIGIPVVTTFGAARLMERATGNQKVGIATALTIWGLQIKQEIEQSK